MTEEKRIEFPQIQTHIVHGTRREAFRHEQEILLKMLDSEKLVLTKTAKRAQETDAFRQESEAIQA